MLLGQVLGESQSIRYPRVFRNDANELVLKEKFCMQVFPRKIHVSVKNQVEFVPFQFKEALITPWLELYEILVAESP